MDGAVERLEKGEGGEEDVGGDSHQSHTGAQEDSRSCELSEPDPMRPAGDGVGNLQGVLVEFARDNPSAQKHRENRDGYPNQGVLGRIGLNPWTTSKHQCSSSGQPTKRQERQNPVPRSR